MQDRSAEHRAATSADFPKYSTVRQLRENSGNDIDASYSNIQGGEINIGGVGEEGKKERWEALGREPPVVSLIYLSYFVVVTLQNLSRPWFGCFGDLGIFWVGEIGIEVDWVWCED